MVTWSPEGNAQEASRRVSVKKEQSNFEVQARCRFWPKFTLYFISPTMSDAFRKVARGQGEVSAVSCTPAAA
eukprot:1159856-Pelagomonas_calceolata.AAC.4